MGFEDNQARHFLGPWKFLDKTSINCYSKSAI